MAKKTSLTVRLRIDGARELLDTFRQLPKEANDKLRDAAQAIAADVAEAAQRAARSKGAQAALLASTVKAVRDRVPVVQAGGTKRLGRHKAPAYKLLFGSEFGMNRRSGWYAAKRYEGSVGRQFPPHQGRKGHWFFPTVEAQQEEITSRWLQAAAEILEPFGGEG